MRCNQDLLSCPADKDQHTPDCPWHPANMQTLVVSEKDFDHLLEELERPPRVSPRLRQLMHQGELTESELKEVDKIVDMTVRGVHAGGYVSGLALRYNVNRWCLIVEEARRQVWELENS